MCTHLGLDLVVALALDGSYFDRGRQSCIFVHVHVRGVHLRVDVLHTLQGVWRLPAIVVCKFARCLAIKLHFTVQDVSLRVRIDSALIIQTARVLILRHYRESGSLIFVEELLVRLLGAHFFLRRGLLVHLLQVNVDGSKVTVIVIRLSQCVTGASGAPFCSSFCHQAVHQIACVLSFDHLLGVGVLGARYIDDRLSGLDWLGFNFVDLYSCVHDELVCAVHYLPTDHGRSIPVWTPVDSLIEVEGFSLQT